MPNFGVKPVKIKRKMVPNSRSNIKVFGRVDNRSNFKSRPKEDMKGFGGSKISKNSKEFEPKKTFLEVNQKPKFAQGVIQRSTSDFLKENESFLDDLISKKNENHDFFKMESNYFKELDSIIEQSKNVEKVIKSPISNFQHAS